MIGVPILQNPDDEDSDQDHYVSFVILSNAFDDMSKIVVNSKTFEEAGGVSENPFNFVAQNIFCHNWSIWFILDLLL